MSKTQSKLGITIPDKTKTPYAKVYKDTQTFIEGSGPTKLDFSGASITNGSAGGLTTDIPNDNFVKILGSADGIEITYYGTVEFDSFDGPQRLIVSVYVNGSTSNEYAYQEVTTTIGSTKTPISGSFIVFGPPGFTLDLRFDATLGDITVKNIHFTLKSINRLY